MITIAIITMIVSFNYHLKNIITIKAIISIIITTIIKTMIIIITTLVIITIIVIIIMRSIRVIITSIFI